MFASKSSSGRPDFKNHVGVKCAEEQRIWEFSVPLSCPVT